MRHISRYIRSKIRPYRIIRDFILVFLSVVIGSIISVSTLMDIESEELYSDWPIPSIVMIPIGLSIVGAINPTNRWLHLAVVTILTMAYAYLVNLFVHHQTFGIITCLFYLSYYVVGGLLSMLYPMFRNREGAKVNKKEFN